MVTTKRLKQLIGQRVTLLFYDDTRAEAWIVEVNPNELVYTTVEDGVDRLNYRTYIDPKDIFKIEVAIDPNP